MEKKLDRIDDILDEIRAWAENNVGQVVSARRIANLANEAIELRVLDRTTRQKYSLMRKSAKRWQVVRYAPVEPIRDEEGREVEAFEPAGNPTTYTGAMNELNELRKGPTYLNDLQGVQEWSGFRVGDQVVHKQTQATRTIVELYYDIEGGVRLDKEVAGYVSWNVTDLQRVTSSE